MKYRLFISIFLLTLLALTSHALKAAETPISTPSFTPEQRAEIEQIVYEYLIANPRVLVEVSDALQKQETVAMQQRVSDIVKGNFAEFTQAPLSPKLGNPKGDIQVIEFFDYQCPYCRQMYPVMQELIKTDTNVQVIYKHFPIISPISYVAARISLAAQGQGMAKWKKFHQALLEAEIAAEHPLTEERIWEIAKQVGLNESRLREDVQSPEIHKQLNADRELAEALGLMGSPAFIILSNAYDTDAMRIRFIPGFIHHSMLQEVIQQIRQPNS